MSGRFGLSNITVVVVELAIFIPKILTCNFSLTVLHCCFIWPFMDCRILLEVVLESTGWLSIDG